VAIDVAFISAENVLAGHDVHHVEPIVSLYLPIAHAEHGGIGGPKICHSIIVK
jgi:hypothetical protein